MEKRILIAKYIRDKIVLIFENLRNWFRRQLPYEFRRWFIRDLYTKIPGISPSKMSPKLFLGGLQENQKLPTLSSEFPPQTTGIDVICLVNTDWDFRYQGSHQLVAQFAQHGNRCFYVNQAFQQVFMALIIQYEYWFIASQSIT